MRVVAGKAKGIVLKTLEGLDTRPTIDRVKESIFSMVGPEFHGMNCLDLFAGSGSLGIEAASRGAEKVMLVEMKKALYPIIEDNISRTKLGDVVKYSIMDVNRFIAGRQEIKYDIVFMDPPYFKGHIVPVMELMVAHAILNEDAIVVCEHDSSEDIPDVVGRFERIKSKKYGRVGISVYRLGA